MWSEDRIACTVSEVFVFLKARARIWKYYFTGCCFVACWRSLDNGPNADRNSGSWNSNSSG